jgi:hypothetical protein
MVTKEHIIVGLRKNGTLLRAAVNEKAGARSGAAR